MKRFSFVIGLFCFACSTNGSSEKSKDDISSSEVLLAKPEKQFTDTTTYTVVDKAPEFDGGEEAMF